MDAIQTIINPDVSNHAHNSIVRYLGMNVQIEPAHEAGLQLQPAGSPFYPTAMNASTTTSNSYVPNHAHDDITYNRILRQVRFTIQDWKHVVHPSFTHSSSRLSSSTMLIMTPSSPLPLKVIALDLSQFWIGTSIFIHASGSMATDHAGT
ncbi:hypothetical protein M405DRAFT_860650 [Rhizopogon salebrosus TDB-379]|nr:hypothetical protein M405DRAFT_860650 [Rhizopogon salebrosus TDB-379]